MAFLPYSGNSKTDGCERRSIHRAALRDLQEQRLVRLLEAGPCEDDDPIGTLAWADSLSGQAVLLRELSARLHKTW